MKQAKEFFLRRTAAVLAFLMVAVLLPTGTPASATETVLQEEQTAQLAAIAPQPEPAEPMATTEDGLMYQVASDYVVITGYIGASSQVVIPAEIEGLPVTSIGGYAFFDCTGLTSVTIGSGVTSIGYFAFYGCTGLTSVKIGSGVTSIGDNAFRGCTGLTSVTIPDSVTSIGYSAFSGCTGLTSVKIGSGVTGIGDWAFSGCTGLTSISVASGNTVYHSAGNCLIETASKTLIQGCNTSVIPSDGSVTSIGYSAFSVCTGLTSVTIPDSVTSIGGYAFSGCTGLTSVTIGSGVTSIGYFAFYGCTGLTSVKIGSGVTSIGDNAFRGCTGLTSVTIPDSVTSIGYSAFSGCTGLTSVTIPDSVTSIGDWAFNGCTGLTSISVASGNTVYHSAGNCLIETASKTLIQGCNTSVIPSDGSVTSIGYSAFNGCTGLTSVTIPDSVTSIDESAFRGCTGLTSVTIPDSVTEINGYYTGAFENCSSLTSIQISNSVTRIGNRAFSGCSSLTSIVLPESLSSISWEMFNGCSSLSEITIPESVTKIVYRSFVGCDSLSDVYYGGSKSGWDAISIGHSNEDLTNATIHYAKVDAHDTIDQLTEADYMLFSILAYRDLSGMLGNPTADPVKEPKTIGEYYAAKWDKVIPASDGDLGHLKATYEQVFGGIANWFPTAVRKESNGFGATIFGNESGDYVIAYCGSLPPNKWFDQVLNAGNDWLVNDLPMELFDIAGPQVSTAIGLYESVSSTIDRENIAVTGHSLGGGLGNIVSAYSGCKGVTFNAITCLDTAYDTMPGWMGWEFDGVDKWNFVDHVNENDALAGKFEAYGDIVPLKPYIEHDNRFGTWDLGANHGMGSFITTGNDSYPALTAEVGEYRPNQVLTHMLRGSVLKLYVELGTSRNDSIKKGLDTIAPIRAYGGDGADKIYTSSRADYLIGGRGDDVLDGSYGDDNYLYYKGDGLDFIYDISGDDILYLYGFSESDTISAVENPDSEFIVISCNGQAIAKISKNNREYSGLLSGDSFKVKVTINGNQETINITELFNTHKAGYRLIVGCPVSVEVLDPNGNVVHTLTDGEVGSWYTDYGNFYVFEEENGEYGKVLDLIEGYTARIVGAGEGTMNVTYQVPVDGELTDPVSVSDIPVNESLIATIEEEEDGDVYLVIDEDGDGETDSVRKLYGECPFTDVPEGSFYYEPVMWAVEEGITNGATETTYNPNGACLRAQVVTFLHRADGNPEPTSTRNPFTDVKSSDFFYKPVLWAVEKGVTNGVSATAFGSYANCNRAAVVTFLWRAAGSPEPESTNNPFVDVKTTDFFYKPVLWAVENGITNGVDATHFGPATDCNRAQVVTFLYRAYN